MTPDLDPALDLTVTRLIKAPRTKVWRAWADPRLFEQWWVPAPAKTRVLAMDMRPGGSFVTEYAENGVDFGPHVAGCFLAVEEGERIVFTDALLGGWRPAPGGFVTAIITFRDHPEGTDYAALAKHKSTAERDRHVEMGFFDGWTTVIEQLAGLVEGTRE